MNIYLQENIIFNVITKKLKKTINYTELIKNKTSNGKTQKSENYTINIIKNILDYLQLDYTRAGSQQPYDFRIKLNKNHILLLEIKRTNSRIIYCNDTLPSKNAWYIIFYTGKIPKIITLNGEYLIKDSEDWIYEFKNKLNLLKQEYNITTGSVSCYPRPTWKINLKHLLEFNK